ncbi:alpha-amylase family glycosyl hydrolase [Cerasicoccus fimbriatus]|uniref:alpha-amylase family glycosyl hydrolase n=1 Tax=Cerasicoccus fimbriatus TaxID=3014554 RepID=UPI0022B4B78A|nr:alpha-amylase family glycosyl hydrolase [Cerasicoccus sp. TK19100]
MANSSRIIAAYWTAPGKGVVLMNRNWTSAAFPDLYLDADGLEIKTVKHMDPVELAKFTGFYEHKGDIIFCIDPKRFPHVDFEANPVRVAGPFNNWGRDNQSRWNLTADKDAAGETIYTVTVPRGEIGSASSKLIFKFVTQDWHWLTPLRCAPNVEYDKADNANYRLNLTRSGKHAFEFKLAKGERGMDRVCRIGWRDGGSIRNLQLIKPGLSFYDLKTDALLGPTVRGRETTFRIFAPRAKGVILELYDDLDCEFVNQYDMALTKDQLCWEVTLKGNMHGWYYYFYVDGENDGVTTEFDSDRPILDPYAMATVSHEGPGIVINTSQTPKPRKVHEAPPWQDLVLLECHVRDIAAKAPMKISQDDRLGFKGVTQFLKNEMCYLRTLGANVLEFQPLQQFDSTSKEEYHWGYMTTNYFSPCAWYGSNPAKAAQNDEFLELVETCHYHDLSVVVDVVYNHVGVPNFLGCIDKAYYFYLADSGEYINWSGCGNTLNAESAMAKRLMIDSLKYFVEAYDVDGFRFDLAELLTVETLKEIGDELKAVKESIILIAEPWSFRGGIQWDTRLAGYAFWNDGYRSTIADYVKGNSNADALAYYMKGCLDHMAAWPAQSVNYTASHDDRCWIDKITTNNDYNGENPSELDIQRTHLMAAITLCAVGMPMFSEGQDFLRSKQGINNTYQRGDINALDYGRLQRHQKTHEFFRELIGLRRSEWGELLRLWDKPSPGYLRVFKCDNGERSAAALLFNADCALGPRQLLFAVNPHREPQSINLQDVDGLHWKCVANNTEVIYHGFADNRMDGHHHRLNLRDMDVGIWVREFPKDIYE